MHCKTFLTVLETSRLRKVNFIGTGVDHFPFEYERSKFISLRPTSGLTRYRLGDREVAEGGHKGIRSTYREALADRDMSRNIAERVDILILEMGDYYTEYPVLGRQHRVIDFRIRPMSF